MTEIRLAGIRRADTRTRWIERLLLKVIRPALMRWRDEVWAKAKQAVGEGNILLPPVPFPRSVASDLRQGMIEGFAHGYANGYKLVQQLYRIHSGKRAPALSVRLADETAPDWESAAAVGHVQRALEGFIEGEPAAVWRDVIPEDALRFLNGYTPELVGVLERDVLDRVSRAISEVTSEGGTVSDRMARVAGVLDDLEAFPMNRLEAIARTESMRAYNLGSLSSMARLHGNGHVVEGVEFSAILDNRTTDICRERHGLKMRIDDPDLSRNTPPLHPNCRSVLVPIIWGEVEDGWSSDPEWGDAENEAPSMLRQSDLEAVRETLRTALSM